MMKNNFVYSHWLNSSSIIKLKCIFGIYLDKSVQNVSFLFHLLFDFCFYMPEAANISYSRTVVVYLILITQKKKRLKEKN